MGAAGAVYWTGRQSRNPNDDLAMVGYNKAQSQQMGVLYGKMGTMVDDFLDALKRPATLAAIIAAASTIFAIGCFQFARPARDAESLPAGAPDAVDQAKPPR